eukprot:TRINITY_DN4590_c0_g2_i1.p1 TRINITY_DN4590_c0_g2~~TRINITY_DN4590_c0_g2_i1.p1  ORF type:complete len:223 (+),score=30.24 TRINITY_DN4590_c0_g2_i1:167-835(+)
MADEHSHNKKYYNEKQGCKNIKLIEAESASNSEENEDMIHRNYNIKTYRRYPENIGKDKYCIEAEEYEDALKAVKINQKHYARMQPIAQEIKHHNPIIHKMAERIDWVDSMLFNSILNGHLDILSTYHKRDLLTESDIAKLLNADLGNVGEEVRARVKETHIALCADLNFDYKFDIYNSFGVSFYVRLGIFCRIIGEVFAVSQNSQGADKHICASRRKGETD